MTRESFAARIGEAIKARRLEADLSQEALAKWVGTSGAHVCRWEKGVQMPDLLNLMKLCVHLGCEPSDIIGDPKEIVGP